MQSRESSEAVAQAPGAAQQPAATKPLTEQTLDQLTELAALGWAVSEHYTAQLSLTKQMAKAEWQLTGRSLFIAAGLMVCFGAGLILLWGTLLSLLGYILLQVTGSVLVAAIALLLLQVALLWWCWRSLGYVLSQVGFSKTWRQLRRVLFAKQPARAKTNPGANHAD